MPKSQNKQQETYADMTTVLTERQRQGIVTPIGIYCSLWVATLNNESCEVSNCQTQSVNKRYSICPKIHSQKRHIPFGADFTLQKYYILLR